MFFEMVKVQNLKWINQEIKSLPTELNTHKNIKYPNKLHISLKVQKFYLFNKQALSIPHQPGDRDREVTHINHRKSTHGRGLLYTWSNHDENWSYDYNINDTQLIHHALIFILHSI
jgi:hypothetical protein